MIKVTKVFILFLLLTLMSQVGGLIYFMNRVILKKIVRNESVNLNHFVKRISFHLSIYLVFTFIFIPIIAAFFGRVPLPVFEKNHLKPRSILTVLLNRHYVNIELKKIVMDKSEKMGKKNAAISINYFDANFPFYFKTFITRKGFPLFPHLSHSDGKKLDLGFIYKDKHTGKIINKTPSVIGYGISEEPLENERNRPKECDEHWMYSLLHAIYPQSAKHDYIFDQYMTSKLIELFINEKKVQKIFLEPHLKYRMKLYSAKVREVQCASVRHDDHFHIQIF